MDIRREMGQRLPFSAAKRPAAQPRGHQTSRQAFHAKGVRGLQVLTRYFSRYRGWYCAFGRDLTELHRAEALCRRQDCVHPYI